MANRDAARGFTPVRYSSGKAYTGAANRYYISSTAAILGVGDLVIRATNSSDPEGGPEVIEATAGSAITGSIVALVPQRGDLAKNHIASADAGYVMVADDADLLLEVQEVTGGTALAVVNVGEHIDQTASTADTTTGRSTLELDNAALATNNTFRIEELSRVANNAVGEHAAWLVKANLHTERNASTTSITEV